MNLTKLIQLPKVLAADYSLTGPGIQPSDEPATQVEEVLSTVIGFLTIVAAIFFVIQIILAGYGFISGQGDEKKIEASRKKLTDSILGLTIVVIALGLTAFISSLLGLGNVFDLNSFVKNIDIQSLNQLTTAGESLQ